MRIGTPRLILRAPARADAPAMLRIRNSRYVREFNPMRPWDLPRMETEIEKDIQSEQALYIDEKASGTLIGGIWLEPDDLRYGVTSFTLSYYLDESAANKGYMTEALRAALPYAFENLGAELVAARVFAPNAGSARVLEKLGFSREGTLRRAVRTEDGATFDDMLFSLLREDF